MLRLIPLLLLWSLCSGASAQKLYKCRVEGKLIYSGAPCKGVPSEAVEVPDAPKPDPGAAQELKREQATLAKLEKERLAREAQEKRFAASDARLAAGRKDRCEKLLLQKKLADADVVTGGEDNPALKERAQRVAEYVASECPD
jgi:hypothetical protein